MATKYVWLGVGDSARIGESVSIPLSLPTQSLMFGQKMGFLKSIDVPLGYTAISAIKFYFRRTGTGNLYLKFATAHTSKTSGSTPTEDVDSYTVYAGGSADSKIAFVTVPAIAYSALTALTAMTAGDLFSIAAYRDASVATDTYTTDLDVAGFLIEFTTASYSSGTVAAATNAIISLDEIKDYLKIPLATGDEDDFLQLTINYQSTWIERQIRNKVVSQLISNEYSYWTGRNIIRTQYFPIISLTVLQYLNTSDVWTDLLTTIGDAILTNPENCVSHENNSFHIELPDGYTSPTLNGDNALNLKKSYNAGYAVIPTELHDVCLERVVDYFKQSRRGKDRFGIQNESISGTVQGGSTSYIDFSPRHKEMMKPFVRRYE